ncbi:non-specific lipid transfer protein GPI-anchored 29 isoform X2 [Raphanus sativus]|uniref:Non-specific lipid transfer protein GPI-anchored 29 isoform X2 n=1 Tax=Raphanus sativus TaxID=3726 RepID=A0A9W3C9F1_RAPSA|nr:non-specific lipid transfer protein GPI-anchored 29 isoform X2 [Raphanus sativus]
MAVFSASFPLLLLFLSVSSLSVNGNTVECSAVIPTMAKCLPFVMIGSQLDKPATECCSVLKTVLETKAECLCEGLKSSGAFGITLNTTKAATLPAACKLNAPPMSACSSSTKPPASAPVPAAGPSKGLGPGLSTAPAPSPSHSNHGSSISVLSFAISGALVILFARI